MRTGKWIVGMMLTTIVLAAVVLTTMSCSEVKRAVLTGNKGDSLIYQAGVLSDYDRVLVLTDSLEQTGDITEVNANRWRGVAYYYKGQSHAAEHYYRKVVNAEIKTSQDLLGYNKSARRLADLLLRKTDYEGALQVALPAVKKLEETNSGSPADFAILLNNIGLCQLNLGNIKEAADSYDRSFRYYQEAAEADTDGRATYEALLGASRAAVAYLNAKFYAESQPWTDRCEKLVEQWTSKTNAYPALLDEHRGRIFLYRATALQGLGHAEEAALAYNELLKTQYGQSDAGRIDATDYLVAAGRYGEAANNYRKLNSVAKQKNVNWSLEYIQALLLPKFRANVGAGLRDSAIAVGKDICQRLDSAIITAKYDAAAEMATIYDTQQKEAQIARQQADLSRQRWIGTLVALALVIVFFSIYTYHKRRAQQRLAHAHTKLQQAYDQLEETTAAKERIESELRIARDIQMSMVPSAFPNRPGLDLYASVSPAKEVGGDLYGYILIEDMLYFCLGDVSGKGVPASLFMAQATRLFRTLATQRMMPAEIVTRMNTALTEDNEQGMFVTLFVGLVNLTTGRLDFCNAGHNPPVLGGGADGGAFIDMIPNAPIGLWSGLEFEGEYIESIKGRPLFIYSDGLNEAENREQQQFGDDHLLDVLRHLENRRAKQVIERMYAEVEKHRNGAAPNDDLTMMCLRIECD